MSGGGLLHAEKEQKNQESSTTAAVMLHLSGDGRRILNTRYSTEIVENKLVFVVDVAVGEEEVFSGGRDGVVGDSANVIYNRVDVVK
ncbi:hypothetical protein FEM48_Zijuj10G0015500 [Ziziphus jujuba var. spinosa]|uniref:Uncharacterized protein n=1 Tax=Ziziphus jujuba var. spinosa TaxID=714518 RepID=A0A978UKI1_ZIZJJ|nr:hypothetical protein FEM48_Zijuj10G0015500 [Ziziphus jujuba var. spinosa]